VRLFPWLDFFTNDLKDALCETTVQFHMIEAQRKSQLPAL